MSGQARYTVTVSDRGRSDRKADLTAIAAERWLNEFEETFSRSAVIMVMDQDKGVQISAREIRLLAAQERKYDQPR